MAGVKKDACLTPPAELERDLTEVEGPNAKAGKQWADIRMKVISIEGAPAGDTYKGGAEGFLCSSTAAVDDKKYCAAGFRCGKAQIVGEKTEKDKSNEAAQKEVCVKEADCDVEKEKKGTKYKYVCAAHSLVASAAAVLAVATVSAW